MTKKSFIFLIVIALIIAIKIYWSEIEPRVMEYWTQGRDIVTFFIAIITLHNLFKRFKTQETQTNQQQQQIDIQIKQRIDERFFQAITLLGGESQSVRIGAIYLLYKLAFNEESYRNDVVELLLLHIRNTTKTKSYQNENENKPSNEIGATIDLLFSKEVNGLYPSFNKGWSDNQKMQSVCLKGSYLKGVNFEGLKKYIDLDAIHTFTIDGKNAK